MNKEQRRIRLDESFKAQLKGIDSAVKRYRGSESKIDTLLLGPASGRDEDSICLKPSDCIFFNDTFSCAWLRESMCAAKCKARMRTQRELGVNSGIIKYRHTAQEIKIKRKILKGIRQAELIESEIRKRELSKQKSDRMKRLNEIMWGIKSILKDKKEHHEEDDADEIAKTSKYSHLKRLI